MKPHAYLSLLLCCLFHAIPLIGADVCPDIPVEDRINCHPDDNPNKDNCNARGCLWCFTGDPDRPCVYNSTGWPPVPYDDNHRVDCYPESNANLEKCQARGCIYQAVSQSGPPWCYLPLNYGYKLRGDPQPTTEGYSLTLQRINYTSMYGQDIDVVYMDVSFDSDEQLRIKIHDGTSRYEVPLDMLKTSSSGVKSDERMYDVVFENNPFFSFQVVRRSTGRVIFDTSLGGMTFSNQFLQIATLLPSNNVYGFGENEQRTFKNNLNWNTMGFFSRDQPPAGNTNMYGMHPHYTVLEDDGNAHSVLFLNSNAQEVSFMPTPALIYRTIGGILDIYFFLGPTPEDTVKQYTNLVGRFPLPPYWSLGFQLSRWGYNNLDGMKKVDERNREAGIPQDVQVADIDLMDRRLVFTYDKTNFAGFPEYVQELHSRGMKFVPIVDPGISTGEKSGTYQPFDLGQQMDVWVKRSDGTPALGKVWPDAPVMYPDFLNPKTVEYWAIIMKNFKNVVDWDGLWIDMNEPSNMVNGDYSKGCAQNQLNYPPYKPKIAGDTIFDKTLCLDDVQYNNQLHYNVHGLYGWSESAATYDGIVAARGGKRAFVLSRSTYPGSGRWAAHWLGDNYANWENLRHSIIGVMQFNHYGIPMVGADICGFNQDSNAELCQRWMELGAFYPFSRNHNTIGAKEQDPAAWGERIANSSRDALLVRYTLLPYLYTLFYYHNVEGSTVARALWHEFPQDIKATDIDHQFMWGSAFLISPVVVQGSVSVQAYFPEGLWYSYYDGEKVESIGQTITLAAPRNFIPLHVRGGYIIPTQDADINTVKSRRNPLGLIAAFDQSGVANGSLYYDDGDSTTSLEDKQYYLAKFTAIRDQGILAVQVIHDGYSGMNNLTFGTVRIFGTNKVSSVKVNNRNHPDFVSTDQELTVKNIGVIANQQLYINWA